MRVLLDTHVWLWFVTGESRMPDRFRAIIEDPANELWLSPLSFWETHLLLKRGRLPARHSPAAWIAAAQRACPVREAVLTFAIAVRARTIEVRHQDPVDRFIAATAIEMKLPLLTADAHLRECPGLNCL